MVRVEPYLGTRVESIFGANGLPDSNGAGPQEPSEEVATLVLCSFGFMLQYLTILQSTLLVV